MKSFIGVLLFFIAIGLTTSTAVYAEHYSIVICEQGEKGDIRVVATGIDGHSRTPKVGHRFRPCVDLICQLGAEGYKISQVLNQEKEIEMPVLIDWKNWGDGPSPEPIKVKSKRELVFILEKSSEHE
ncbi:MAG: hypothetical protein GY712_11290 [Oceanicoccus sp.]|uniref:hypothetical protein n=1 Tax=Oceanicoccus sp. TaxID=2691044 RepID=UPI0026365527|nr:hypothetical protein [Oceanicoccus sp.]MCP3908588.1 hypothetical protein [Oceanicoccus sp.]